MNCGCSVFRVSDLIFRGQATNNNVAKDLDLKGVTMNAYSRKRLFLSLVAVVVVLMMLGQTSVIAQSNLQQLKQKIISGGSYQIIDVATAPCSGQCPFANWQTGDCTCPQGFAPVGSARMLLSVGDGPEGAMCGATLFSCVLQIEE
jgi:hypothetical protein